MNRIACLRLTQRCADILICVRQEVQDAGGDVGDELEDPVDLLINSLRAFFVLFFWQHICSRLV
jgi:abelson tyrosine-protein kinase 1